MWRKGDECGGEGEMCVEGKGRCVWRGREMSVEGREMSEEGREMSVEGKGDECGGEGEMSEEGKGDRSGGRDERRQRVMRHHNRHIHISCAWQPLAVNTPIQYPFVQHEGIFIFYFLLASSSIYPSLLFAKYGSGHVQKWLYQEEHKPQ